MKFVKWLFITVITLSFAVIVTTSVAGIIKCIKFNKNCRNNITAAANASTAEESYTYLTKAIKFLEDNDLHSIEDVTPWYNLLKEYQNKLQNGENVSKTELLENVNGPKHVECQPYYMLPIIMFVAAATLAATTFSFSVIEYQLSKKGKSFC